MDRDAGAGRADEAGGGGRAGVLRTGLALSGMSVLQLWWACAGIGETVEVAELEQALTGRYELTDRQFDVVAQALNDRMIDLGVQRMVPTAAEIRDGRR